MLKDRSAKEIGETDENILEPIERIIYRGTGDIFTMCFSWFDYFIYIFSIEYSLSDADFNNCIIDHYIYRRC